MNRFVPTLQWFRKRLGAQLVIDEATRYVQATVEANLERQTHSIRLLLGGEVTAGMAPSTEMQRQIAAQVGAALEGFGEAGISDNQGFRHLLSLSLGSTVSAEG